MSELKDTAKDVAFDVLDDGELTSESVSRVKRVGIALAVGLLAAVFSTVATVLVTVPVEGEFDLPSLMETLRLAVVGTVVAYVKDKL
ncbi:hypothetical protein E1264_03485 [Actinomadura sp. KC216]|uniref:hypothetical protein n=1 Tax=Actinomadura sp. KC216 TaxID=2530370 RepID=UPI001045934C|nr:hypothetical protein [Actinomadura sp. KC216]TDB90902.1 hypothetical protein E1264_03485 [Actinomadura sp. KC216]